MMNLGVMPIYIDSTLQIALKFELYGQKQFSDKPRTLVQFDLKIVP